MLRILLEIFSIACPKGFATIQKVYFMSVLIIIELFNNRFFELICNIVGELFTVERNSRKLLKMAKHFWKT